VEAELFRADRRTDRRDEANGRFFRNFAKARKPNNLFVRSTLI